MVAKVGGFFCFFFPKADIDCWERLCQAVGVFSIYEYCRQNATRICCIPHVHNAGRNCPFIPVGHTLLSVPVRLPFEARLSSFPLSGGVKAWTVISDNLCNMLINRKLYLMYPDISCWPEGSWKR